MEPFLKAKTILEYNKVIDIVSSHIRTESGREAVKELEPSGDVVCVKRRLAETAKAKEMLSSRSMPSFGAGKNVIPSVERAAKGAVLTPRELLEIQSLLRSASALRAYPNRSESLGALEQYFELIRENRTLDRAIGDAIIAEDLIADTASDELFRIRRSMRKCESDVRDVLSRYTAGSYSKYLQENIVTMRNGRYVVPVRAEFKNEIKGLVHDTSSSGQTLFIEPMAVLEANNKLRELKSAESHEIERILQKLSEQVTLSAEIISADYNVITDLSVIFGKADYSFAIEATSPVINEKDMSVKLVNARHPLLDKETVVPISVSLGGAEDGTLVITGPNTGGKTVTLKTIGLLAMMTQAGLDIPCDHGTVMPVFDDILPDIGDEQSIEQSLSTFSAHIKNIVGIINSASNRSLVLYDELGAGTDPTEGAALAIAILEDMRRIGAVTAATTHYAELKTYALETDGVMNASCEFDVETLKPTYRLVTGLPGRSNAFAISTRLGIPDRIIERARSVLSEESVHFEDVIGRLEEAESRLSSEKEHADKILREAEAKLAEAKAEKEKAEKLANEKLAKAEDKAARIMAQAKASSDYIFDELNKLRREAEKEKKFDNIESARKLIRDEIKNSGAKDDTEAPEEEYKLPRPLVTGDDVMINGINKKAVVTAIDGENVTVRAGIITTKVKMSELRLCEEKPVQPKQKGGTTYSRPAEAVKNEVDVRGLTGDDAYFVIDRYFESAIMAGYHTVSIIHGKGTGALRNAVWDHLRHDKRVLSFRSGRYGEGDTGVTIVEFK